MNVVQAWLLVGVPGLVVVAALFTGRSRWRAVAGYLVLAALTLTFLSVDGGALWGGLIGLVAVGLVATGRGLADVDEQPEEQDTRDRYTHAG
jgi:hypothetical protein